MAEIRYLNTDLDLVATLDPSPLVAGLEERGLRCLHVYPGDDGLWYATLETEGIECDTPEESIAAMLDSVESLTAEASAVWSRCTLREFNIGYDCGDCPWAFSNGLTNRTLLRAAALGASLRLTLYPPEKPQDAGNAPGTAG